MTESESKSDTSNGLPELITKIEEALENVQLAVNGTEYTNRDLVALTVEVETLREDLANTLTKDESEVRRRGITAAYLGTTIGAIQLTDAHVEVCRVEPLIHRFQQNNGLTPVKEFFCDVSFPTHNHGQLNEVGDGLHAGNAVGVGVYSILAIGVLSWWLKAKLASRRQRQIRQERDKKAREAAKIIYNGPSHSVTRGAVSDLDGS